jgi:hypothetical protein
LSCAPLDDELLDELDELEELLDELDELLDELELLLDELEDEGLTLPIKKAAESVTASGVAIIPITGRVFIRHLCGCDSFFIVNAELISPTRRIRTMISRIPTQFCDLVFISTTIEQCSARKAKPNEIHGGRQNAADHHSQPV